MIFNKDFNAVVGDYLNDKQMRRMIDNGSSWNIFYREYDGSHFRITGSVINEYRNLMSAEDLLDIVCGVLDHIGIRYTLVRSARGTDECYYFIDRVDE